eukprot:TRINITY_DN20391_c0_g1_i1.p1 TRINITY_DN20391_c0_g1~~TRINITY_DN20391_c0_g1_i1.p1  ORF type:complete len:772 (+),score=194.65 TRINITY_DN20391_c0_g1_i1:2-2317(+)
MNPKKNSSDNDPFFHPDKTSRSTLLASALAEARRIAAQHTTDTENVPSPAKPSLAFPTRPETRQEPQLRNLSHRPGIFITEENKAQILAQTNGGADRPITAQVLPDNPVSVVSKKKVSSRGDILTPLDNSPRHSLSSPKPTTPKESQIPSETSASQKISAKEKAERAIWREIAKASTELESAVASGDSLSQVVIGKMVEAIESDRSVDFRFTTHISRRDDVVASMAPFLESENPILVVRACKVILYLVPNGKIQSAACKSLYLLSKNPENDFVFVQERVLAPLTWVLSCAESTLTSTGVGCDVEFASLLFSSGCIKNFSDHEEARNILLNSNSISFLSSFIKPNALEKLKMTLRPDTQANSSDATRLQQFLVQITAILRNMSVKDAKSAFVQFSVIKNLCELIPPYDDNQELMLNIVRILSKMSLFQNCLDEITFNSSYISYLLRLLYKHPLIPTITIRVCFILGNATTSNDEVRLMIAEENSAIDPIINLLCTYHRIDSEDVAIALTPRSQAIKVMPATSSQGASLTSQDAEQVLVKIVRLIANLSVNTEVGQRIASAHGIDVLITLLETKSIKKSEELVLNVVGAITNLSFYFDAENIILDHQLKLIELLAPLLMHTNDEVVLEATRAFGNFSRNKECRVAMEKLKVVDILVVLLDHGVKSIVYHACGALMNTFVEQRTYCLLRTEGLQKLIDVFIHSSIEDEDVLLVVGRTLCNLCGDEKTLLDPQQSNMLKAKSEMIKEAFESGPLFDTANTLFEKLSEMTPIEEVK